MILNGRQYNATKGQVTKLNETLKLSKKNKGKIDERVYKAMIAGINSQIDDLKSELNDYKKLQQVKTLNLSSLEDLPIIIIKARVAKGYTQQSFAEKLNLKPQQIQRYEATNYKSVSFKRIVEILKALNIDLKGKIPL